MKAFVLGAGALLLLAIACKKEPVAIPEACMYADKIKVKKGDIVTFTNCSKSLAASLSIYVKGTGSAREGFSFSEQEKQYQFVCTDTGTFSAVLTAHNGQGVAPTMTIPVTVFP